MVLVWSIEILAGLLTVRKMGCRLAFQEVIYTGVYPVDTIHEQSVKTVPVFLGFRLAGLIINKERARSLIEPMSTSLTYSFALIQMK